MNIKKRLFLFWKIGKFVCGKQKYYENAPKKYSTFFSYYYGMSEVFSRSNISYMIKFYCSFPVYFKTFEKLEFEYYKLLVNISDSKCRYFYFRVAIFCRSSVQELKALIKNNVYSYI